MPNLVDADGIPYGPSIEEYARALTFQRDISFALMEALTMMIATDGRECDQGGDLHDLMIGSKCPGCHSRALLATLTAALQKVMDERAARGEPVPEVVNKILAGSP